MAVQYDGAFVPEPTGAVEMPEGPITTATIVGTDSTGAVKTPDGPVTTEFGPSGQEPTGAVETPGPVTTRNTMIKVVRPPKTEEPTATTGQTPETRREARAAERPPQGSDDDGR